MKRLVDLTERCCRWPVGPVPPIGRTEQQLWCGAPRAPGDLFCPEHMKVGCPGRKVRPENVQDRNLVTIKLALMRRRSRDMPAETARQNHPIPAAQARAAAFGAAVAPKCGIIPPFEPEKPASAGFEGGAENGPIGTFSEGLTGNTSIDVIAPRPSDEIGQLDVDTLRPIEPLAFSVLDAQPVPTDAPLVEWMNPTDLLVEAAYQRDLSPRSMDLIKRISERWDWRRFKPPIVAWTERGFEIIDGQHTAFGAATRGIEKIPVLVVEAAQLGDRAAAFVGHNQDRLGITAIQMHQAKIAAGDPDALTVKQVIEDAGASLVIGAYGARGWKAGETVAVTTIDQLAKRRGRMSARRVVEVLVKAEAAPISAAAIKAVDMLMNRPEFAEIDLEHLPATIRAADDVEAEAKLDAKTHGITAWEAMGRIWFRKCRKQRRAA